MVHENFARNAEASRNIFACADVAADPVHEEMSWLNAEASLNIALIVVTCAVFQLPMSWLNAEAEENIEPMVVTFPVSHFEMSPLNVLLPPKPLSTVPSDPFISVTKLVSQCGIVP